MAIRDEIIAAAGKNHKNYIGKALSKELENIMDKRKSALYSKKDDTLIPVVKDDKADCEALPPCQHSLQSNKSIIHRESVPSEKSEAL